MRIIHVCAYYEPAHCYGGPVRSLHTLCRAQQTHGLDVEVFTTTAAGEERLPPAPLGRVIDGITVKYFELSPPARLLGAAGLAPALAAAVPAADLVHLHGLFNRTIWNAAGCLHKAGRAYVLSPRGMLEAPALAHRPWRKRLAWHLKDVEVVRRAHVLHATSSFEYATLERLGEGRVIKVPNPVPLSQAYPADVEKLRAALGIPPQAPVVTSLGRLHRIKRLDLVASAFLELWRQLPSVHLVIAGPDEQQLRGQLEAQLAPAQAVVHWMGTVDEPTRDTLLAASTVLVQCSDSESFGMSVAESLAAGTPVVVTRTCPWEDVETFGCGFWVDQTTDSVAAALRAIVSNPGLARQQGAAGRRLAGERLAPQRVADAWQTAYRDAVRRNPTAA